MPQSASPAFQRQSTRVVRDAFRQCRHRAAINLFGGVIGRDEEANPGGGFGDGGIENWLGIDAAGEQCLRHARQRGELPEDDRNDRRLAAVTGVESPGVGQLQEQRGVVARRRVSRSGSPLRQPMAARAAAALAGDEAVA